MGWHGIGKFTMMSPVRFAAIFWLCPVDVALRYGVVRHTIPINGEVPEWSNGAVSKTVEPSRVPRVRIPVSPPLISINPFPPIN